MSDSVLIDRALLATVIEYAREYTRREWTAKADSLAAATVALEGPAIQNPPELGDQEGRCLDCGACLPDERHLSFCKHAGGRLSLEQGSDQIYTLNDADPYQGVTIRVRSLAVRVNVSDDGLWAKITHREGGPVKEAAYVLWAGVGEELEEDDDA